MSIAASLQPAGGEDRISVHCNASYGMREQAGAAPTRGGRKGVRQKRVSGLICLSPYAGVPARWRVVLNAGAGPDLIIDKKIGLSYII